MREAVERDTVDALFDEDWNLDSSARGWPMVPTSGGTSAVEAKPSRAGSKRRRSSSCRTSRWRRPERGAGAMRPFTATDRWWFSWRIDILVTHRLALSLSRRPAPLVRVLSSAPTSWNCGKPATRSGAHPMSELVWTRSVSGTQRPTDGER